MIRMNCALQIKPALLDINSLRRQWRPMMQSLMRRSAMRLPRVSGAHSCIFSKMIVIVPVLVYNMPPTAIQNLSGLAWLMS
jgi:hypothetical protein